MSRPLCPSDASHRRESRDAPRGGARPRVRGRMPRRARALRCPAVPADRLQRRRTGRLQQEPRRRRPPGAQASGWHAGGRVQDHARPAREPLGRIPEGHDRLAHRRTVRRRPAAEGDDALRPAPLGDGWADRVLQHLRGLRRSARRRSGSTTSRCASCTASRPRIARRTRTPPRRSRRAGAKRKRNESVRGESARRSIRSSGAISRDASRSSSA